MFDEAKLAAENGQSANVTIKEWMLLDCVSFLNIIPIIGSIAAIVIYLVIGFGSSSALSMKSRILASLIWSAIGIVALIVFLFAFGGMAMLASVGQNQ